MKTGNPADNIFIWAIVRIVQTVTYRAVRTTEGKAGHGVPWKEYKQL